MTRWLIGSCAVLAISLPIATVQQIPATDPHAGRFTVGTGFSCAVCHNPKAAWAERMRAGAVVMSKMVAALNTGALRNTAGIDCISCHRRGGPEHNMLHPRPLDRSVVRKNVDAWPGNPRDADDLRRTMTEYTV